MKRQTALMIALMMLTAGFTACGSESAPKPFDVDALPKVTLPDDSGEEPGRTVITDEAEIKKLTHECFIHNTKEEIFQKHTSVTQVSEFSHQADTSRADYSYFKLDGSYLKGNNYEEYEKDRVLYLMRGEADGSNPHPEYFLDLTHDYDGVLGWYLNEIEDVAFDLEHDPITDVYIEDGVLWMISMMDEEASKDYIEEWTGDTYTGGTVKSISLFDAETYEAKELQFYVVKDDKPHWFSTFKVEFDQPEPAEIAALMTNFESTGGPTKTVTFTAEPGTADEISKSITVPVDSYVDTFSKDFNNPEFFADYECKQPFDWDYDTTQDITIYVRNAQ